MNGGTAKTTYSVPPVERAIALLRYIGDGNQASNLSTASRDLGINRTTLIRLVGTLLDTRMIEEIGDGGGYRLGAALVSLGAQAIQGRDIVRTCHPILRALCLDTDMSAHLGVLDGREIVYLSREAPNSHLVSNVRVGSRLPAHASSIGRAILAELPEPDLRALFADEPVQKTTDKTPATVDAIVDQARCDKAAGHAWSQGHFEPGIGSCAAVIKDHTGQAVGGLNISGPAVRFAEDDLHSTAALRRAVIAAARKASAEMGHTPDS